MEEGRARARRRACAPQAQPRRTNAERSPPRRAARAGRPAPDARCCHRRRRGARALRSVPTRPPGFARRPPMHPTQPAQRRRRRSQTTRATAAGGARARLTAVTGRRLGQSRSRRRSARAPARRRLRRAARTSTAPPPLPPPRRRRRRRRRFRRWWRCGRMTAPRRATAFAPRMRRGPPRAKGTRTSRRAGHPPLRPSSLGREELAKHLRRRRLRCRRGAGSARATRAPAPAPCGWHASTARWRRARGTAAAGATRVLQPEVSRNTRN